MDIHSIPGSTLVVMSVAIILSIFYARYSGRDIRMSYTMRTIKEKTAEFKKYQKRFKETQDEKYLKRAMKIQKELMELQKMVFEYQMKRTILSLVIFFTLYYVLTRLYGRSPVAIAPFRIPYDIRSTPVEYNGRIVSGLSFIARYALTSVTFAITLQSLFDRVSRSSLIRGLRKIL